MKTKTLKLIAGTLVMTVAMNAMAAGAGKPIRTLLEEKAREIKLSVLSGKSINQIKGAEQDSAISAMVAKLGISGASQSALITAVKRDSTALEAKINSLAEIAAVKDLANQYRKSADTVKQAETLDKAATAMEGVLISSTLVEGGVDKIVTREEGVEVRTALRKIENMTGDVLTKFEKRDQQMWLEVLTEYNRLMEKGEVTSAADGLVSAIMKIKKCSKEQAVELAKKIKELC